MRKISCPNIKKWADEVEVIDKLRTDAENIPDTQARDFLLNRANEIEQEIELRMNDDSQVIGYKDGHISVKFY